MKSYLALIKIDLKLAMRNKAVLFFSYLFPLGFFIVFSEMMDAQQGGMISYVVSMVLVLGILGNGLFGAGMRAVQERENNILRRYKVAPITPTPILIASMVTGWAVYLPAVLMILVIAHFYYGMSIPHRSVSLFLFASIGIITFRSIGMILASVVNSMQESNILIQLLYMPMLFLSGATFPINTLPHWAQSLSQFLPASYLVTGFQGIFLRNETILQNMIPILALTSTLCLATFISSQVFRWEKEEKIRSTAKLWVLAVLAPFLVLGGYQIYSNDHLRKAEILWRDVRRSENLLISGARLFIGNGKVISSGAVLIKNGKIDQIFEGSVPESASAKAEVIEASGKTLMPGLIDVQVHLAATGNMSRTRTKPTSEQEMARELAAYLYCGITSVRSGGDGLNTSLSLRDRISEGELLGAELFAFSPTFAAMGGYGTQFLDQLSGPIKAITAKQIFRFPTTPEQAKDQVRQLKESGIDGIQAMLVDESHGNAFPSMQIPIFQAVVHAARSEQLPIAVLASGNKNIGESLNAGVNEIRESGDSGEQIGEEMFAQMARKNVAYDPACSQLEAISVAAAGKGSTFLEDSLVQQVGPHQLLESIRQQLQHENIAVLRNESEELRQALGRSLTNLRNAAQMGVMLVTGSDAGSPLILHGPTIHHEMQIWVTAGIPAAQALQAATYNAAKALGAGDQIGLLQKGYEANLLLVDGDPTVDISATERISLIIYKGERVNRGDLLKEMQKLNP
jgi:imidazolonepropionase-like amidohydrolase/ABC-type multidrug transport system permease subunit